MEKKKKIIHLADFQQGINHSTLCGKVFECEDGLPNNMTSHKSKVTCPICQRRIQGATIDEEKRLAMPVDIVIREKELIRKHGSVRRHENAPVVFELYIGKFQVFLTWNELLSLKDKAGESFDKAKSIMKVMDSVDEIDSYINSMQSTIDSFKDNPDEYYDCLGEDLEGDLRDLTEAIENLDC